MKFWTKQDHAGAAFRACPKPCIGGRMTWQWSEPQWRNELGLVGVCTHCGFQAFSTDILNEVVSPTPIGSNRRRARFATIEPTAGTLRLRKAVA